MLDLDFPGKVSTATFGQSSSYLHRFSNLAITSLAPIGGKYAGYRPVAVSFEPHKPIQALHSSRVGEFQPHLCGGGVSKALFYS